MRGEDGGDRSHSRLRTAQLERDKAILQRRLDLQSSQVTHLPDLVRLHERHADEKTADAAAAEQQAHVLAQHGQGYQNASRSGPGRSANGVA